MLKEIPPLTPECFTLHSEIPVFRRVVAVYPTNRTSVIVLPHPAAALLSKVSTAWPPKKSTSKKDDALSLGLALALFFRVAMECMESGKSFRRTPDSELSLLMPLRMFCSMPNDRSMETGGGQQQQHPSVYSVQYVYLYNLIYVRRVGLEELSTFWPFYSFTGCRCALTPLYPPLYGTKRACLLLRSSCGRSKTCISTLHALRTSG